jgi:trehalose-phosphatase
MKPQAFIFLDYDGTLVPIRPTPAQARLSPTARNLLRALAAVPSVTVAIVSGRTLQHLNALIGIPGLYYAGNHGFDIVGPGVEYHVIKDKGFEKTVTALHTALTREVGAVPGVLIEHKGVTLTLHFRRVDRTNVPRVRRAFWKIARPYQRSGTLRVQRGKEVLEARPAVNWNKGKAVRWLLRQCGTSLRESFCLYIGDDLTDEPAFEVVNRHGLSIFVGGAKKTCAQYRLSDHRQVLKFLARLREVMHGCA